MYFTSGYNLCKFKNDIIITLLLCLLGYNTSCQRVYTNMDCMDEFKCLADKIYIILQWQTDKKSLHVQIKRARVHGC